MAWNKKHYKEIKQFVEHQLNHVPFQIAEKPTEERPNPFDWAKTFLPLVSLSIHNEDYEAAKATSDAIREFLNKFMPNDPIPDDATLKLPDFVPFEIKGIVCLLDPKDPLNFHKP